MLELIARREREREGRVRKVESRRREFVQGRTTALTQS